ncbi:hypothetical protein HanXRQr2_Chr16g0751651 [Helianthus annuus]|uniref:Uncharacterized protein n=1 Tax=Helianthus annuus TaxID=4232 RepID=A0A9K3H0H5_HELAN|nr:hypothetical protein HanXRQr2_Chr16g0751651 [Helianthus annuus]
MVLRKPWVLAVCVLSFSILTLITTPTPPLHPTSTKTLIPSLPPLISESKLTLGFTDRRWGTTVHSEIGWGTTVRSEIDRYAGSEAYWTYKQETSGTGSEDGGRPYAQRSIDMPYAANFSPVIA